MLQRNQIMFFIVSFLSVGFLFLSLPEKGFSGLQPIGGCCQFEPDQCSDLGGGDNGDGPIPACLVEDVRPGSCNEETGLCEATPAPIPTLNEWGLITVFIALGIVGVAGIFVYRRRRSPA